ncbi:VOC family protein [Sphingomonas sp.]|uniref:VOC family protein n=1 Tax=Sphingomonas sp. TaxID=28214 RepID=UPI000DB2FAAD|nr:VOC family protein [Sphingomonas sp.]PZU11009.1 MAG: bleomycin resistance protein [Sphingomonas sp.]
MAILGIESVVYGVDDVALCTRFWDDYGLVRADRSIDEPVWELPSGSRIIVRAIDDPDLPPAHFQGSGVRECFLGVDTAENLEKLVARIAVDREVWRDADGTAHFIDPDGNPMGLRIWAKRPVMCRPDPVNAPDHIVRLNQHRKWRMRARPKTINHIVYFSDNYVEAYEFYRDRLDFRMTDHSKANGIFARANGTYEHHTLFWLTTQHPGTRGKRGYAHIAFGCEDVDEVMVGANYMQDKGWSNVRPFAAALNRHRISSAMYYYFPCPAGGDAEYHADSDYLDDAWIPRVWEMAFGATIWGSSSSGFFAHKPATYDVQLDPDEASLEACRHLGKDGKDVPSIY